ncbi:hypothetical protein GYMLUDRAFT_53771 [Collybiopsis luxurians FD-317 M1]|nr:hypothetical protein GYMLUDRAFT_53771 [Collybiopsis luxurians FD-317 M1]
MAEVSRSPTSGDEKSFTTHHPRARTAVLLSEPRLSSESFEGPANREMHPISSELSHPGLNLPQPEFIPARYDEALLSIRTKIARQREALRRHEVPQHWKPPKAKIRRIIFNALCLMAFGRAGLDAVWAAIVLEEEGDESVWAETIRQIIDRLTNISLMAGLLLTTSATFLTTLPPRPDMMNFTLRGPYLCLMGSFALLGGLTVGGSAFLVAGKTTSSWAKEALLSYPFISIATATMLVVFGLLSGVWSATDKGVQGACAVTLFLPNAVAVLFAVSVATAPPKSHLNEGKEFV